MPVTASDRDASRESCMYLFNDEGEVGSKWLNGEENNKIKKRGGRKKEIKADSQRMELSARLQ